VAVDQAGTLYVVDNGNETIRKITPDGMVTTLAGGVRNFGWADGLGSEARFWFAKGIAIADAGDLFVTDSNNNAVRRITSTGMVTTFAGKSSADYILHPGSADGTGTDARFAQPTGIAADAAGNLFVADYVNGLIRKITPDAVVTTFAGKVLSPKSDPVDGPNSVALFRAPVGTDVDNSGNVYVTEFVSNTIRRITPDQEVTTLAGVIGVSGDDDGTGSRATFNGPNGIAVGNGGCLYVVDYWGNRVRKGWPATAPRLGQPKGTPDGSVQLEVNGMAGSSYRIEASSDLVDWTPVAACKSTGSSTSLTVARPGNSSLRFYRAVLE
jgi:sugar lactone lactonase YvrE